MRAHLKMRSFSYLDRAGGIVCVRLCVGIPRILRSSQTSRIDHDDVFFFRRGGKVFFLFLFFRYSLFCRLALRGKAQGRTASLWGGGV